MKTIHLVLKVLLALVLLMPIFGALGIFPPPTRDLYTTDEAFAFIVLIMQSASYITNLIAIVFAVSIVLLFTQREALAALLILPITVNIVGFHTFLDGGLFASGGMLAIVLVLLNLYFLWKNSSKYKILWKA
ncbi:MAG TPA: hypothetical protein VEA59_06190 [Patescibacteria group bacterium]|nr:hypothetical protein [Patescibacteria group bacterium]